MDFSVESWAPEYGSSINLPSTDETEELADATVERALGEWSPIDPAPSSQPGEIAFIDGIQRIDARIWIHRSGISTPAVCVSLAAGATVCTHGAAITRGVQVVRSLVAPASATAGPIITRHATYEFVPAQDTTPEATYLAIHGRRTELEVSVARAVAADLIVFDGPLRGHTDHQGVGYIKTHHKIYLPHDVQAILGSLGDGQRTPLFFLGGGPGGGRWSWYLRLQGPRVHPMSGIVRLELPGTGTTAEAIARAEFVSACLPRYASETHKEARAPQNLYPISGVERELRRRLGDAPLLERALRLAAGRPV
jgi:hypothetical protein